MKIWRFKSLNGNIQWSQKVCGHLKQLCVIFRSENTFLSPSAETSKSFISPEECKRCGSVTLAAQHVDIDSTNGVSLVLFFQLMADGRIVPETRTKTVTIFAFGYASGIKNLRISLYKLIKYHTEWLLQEILSFSLN